MDEWILKLLTAIGFRVNFSYIQKGNDKAVNFSVDLNR